MDTIFGIPMTGVMIALLALLGLCLLLVAWVAWRRPVIFKLGMRNIPRRRAQTTLIVVGLMLSTLIVSAALGTGDTIDHSATSAIYDLLGRVDEVVVYSQVPEGQAATSLSTKIDASALTIVEQAVQHDPEIAGVMPMLFEVVPAVNLAQGQSEPNVVISGIDPSRLDAFGGLIGLDGSQIALGAIPDDAVVLGERAAEKLAAKPGDTLTVFYANRPIALRVAAIARDSVLGGTINTGGLGMAVPLDRLQAATGQTDTLSLIAVANAGGVYGGLDHSDSVTAKLRAALAGQRLGVDPLKQDSVDSAEEAAAIFTDIFLLFGLFSIAAGVLLIVLIFTMLAAERRSEMGMERAVGMQRRQLIQQFVAEGTGYTLAAGLVGAGLGVLAAIAIARVMGGLFGEDLEITAHVAPRSLIVAYSLGVVITFLAVAIASWRISRLNIVAAVRDIPEVSSPKRKRRTLVWAALLLIVGALMILSGISADAVRNRAHPAVLRRAASPGLQRRRDLSPAALAGSVQRARRDLRRPRAGYGTLLHLGHLPGARRNVADRPEHRYPPGHSKLDRGALPLDIAGCSDSDRLSRGRDRQDRADDRDVLSHRLLPGDDGGDEPELRQPHARRRGGRRLGCSRRCRHHEPDRRLHGRAPGERRRHHRNHRDRHRDAA
jgi:putative ABC transport system permease protein